MLPLILSLATLSMPQDGITYQEFEEEVMDYSITLSRSIEQSNAMHHASRAAKTDFLPTVSNEASYMFNLSGADINLGNGDIALKRHAYTLSTNIIQPVLTGGRISNTYKAALLKAQIADEHVQQTLDDIILQAQSVYWGAAAKKAVYTTMCQYVGMIEQFTDSLQERFVAGDVDRTDLLQMQTRLAEAQLQRSSALLAYRNATQAMNSLMGRQPNSPVAPSDSFTDPPPMPFVVDLETALNQRPDYAIDSLQVEHQKRLMNLAVAQHKPTLSVGLLQQIATPIINIDGKPKLTPVFFAKMSMPLIHWGKRTKTLASQRALLNEATLAQSDRYDQVNLELATSLTAVQESRKQIDYATENCRLAQDNLDTISFGYADGRLTILDVLAAQLTWLQANTNLIQSHHNYRMALANYRHATGSD